MNRKERRKQEVKARRQRYRNNRRVQNLPLLHAFKDRNCALRYDDVAVGAEVEKLWPQGVPGAPVGTAPRRFMDAVAKKLVMPTHKQLLAGEPVHNASIKILENETEIWFAYEQTPVEGVRQCIHVVYQNSPQWLVQRVRDDLGAKIKKGVDMPNKIVETANPLVTRKTLMDKHGNKITGAVMDELTQQNLCHHAPVLVDLLRFYRQHKGNPAKVRFVYDKDNPEDLVTMWLYPKSVAELTGGTRGKAAQDAMKELDSLATKPLRLILRTDEDGELVTDNFKGNGGPKHRRAPTFQAGLIRTFTKNTTPLAIEVHPYLLVIEAGDHWRQLPENLREAWGNSRGRKRSRHQELAYFWAHQQLQPYPKQGKASLMAAWGFDPESAEMKNDRGRVEKKFEDCLNFLIDTGPVRDYKIQQEGGKSMVSFVMDLYHLPHLATPPSRQALSNSAG